MANFQQIQNYCLWRLRNRGLNFPGAPGNGPTDQNPPTLLQDLINNGYSEFLSKTLEAGIAVLKIQFLSTANAISYPLRPTPAAAIGGGPNPAVLRVLDGSYTTAVGGQNAGYEYGFDVVSTRRFAAVTGRYTRRLSWFGPRVIYATQQFGRPILDVAPGTAVTGDTIALWIVPDPYNSPANLSAALGGPLTAPTDVPLFPQQFHQALVEYVVMQAGDAADKGNQSKRAEDRWNKYILDAQEFGANFGSGDPERGVQDVYFGTPLGT